MSWETIGLQVAGRTVSLSRAGGTSREETGRRRARLLEVSWYQVQAHSRVDTLVRVNREMQDQGRLVMVEMILARS